MIQQTSRDAYESVNRADDTLYDRVLNCIYDNGSMTCDEVEVEIGGRHQSVSSRIRKGVQDEYAKLITGLRFHEKLKEILDARNSK